MSNIDPRIIKYLAAASLLNSIALVLVVIFLSRQ